jgi:hypothetical protein
MNIKSLSGDRCKTTRYRTKERGEPADEDDAGGSNPREFGERSLGGIGVIAGLQRSGRNQKKERMAYLSRTIYSPNGKRVKGEMAISPRNCREIATEDNDFSDANFPLFFS